MSARGGRSVGGKGGCDINGCGLKTGDGAARCAAAKADEEEDDEVELEEVASRDGAESKDGAEETHRVG